MTFKSTNKINSSYSRLSGSDLGSFLGVPESTGSAPLGNYTKLSSPPPPTLPNTSDLSTYFRWFYRSEAYALQESIRMIFMYKSGLMGTVASMEDYNKLPRVVKCGRTRVKEVVKVRKSKEHGKAFYDGLVFCSSPWSCPVCSAKIQVKRREEIKTCIDRMEAMGKKPIFITLTFPHYASQSCSDTWNILTKGLRGLRNGKAWQKFKSRSGYLGHITSKEIMYGRNGWHPHSHELWFVDADYDEREVLKYIQNKWFNVMNNLGVIAPDNVVPFQSHSVRIGFSRAEYLAKFDHSSYVSKMSSEMSLFNVKKGRVKGSLHPFQLALLAVNPVTFKVNKEAVNLFNEYHYATKGRSQVHFSKGLKEICGIDDKSDDVVVQEVTEQPSSVVSAFENFGWQKVLDLRSRSYILSIAELENSTELIEDWLRDKGLSSFLGFD